MNGFNNPYFNTGTQTADPRQAMSDQMNQQQQKKPWWTSLISEGAGALGAAALPAAALVLAPETGGLSLAALAAGGAFAGGTGGRLVENKIRDNKFNVGSALGEGATDAAFSGFSALNDVRKGSKAVKALSGVTNNLDNPQTLLKVPEKTGLIQNIGQSLKSGASGYGIGAKVGGQNQLTATGSDAIGNTLKTLKIPATAPETQARMLGNHIDNLGNILTAQYSKANIPIAQTEINNLGANILGQVANTAGLSKGAESFALEQAQKLSQAKDVGQVWQFTKDLARNATNFGANPDAKLVDKEAAARIILDQTRGFLNGKVPGVATTNDLYHQAKTAESFILDASKNKGGGLIQRLASSVPAKTAEAKVGSILENVGKYSAGTGNVASKLTGQLRVQAPGNLLGALRQQHTQTQPTPSPQGLLSSGQPQQGQDATNNLLGQTNANGDVTSQLLGQPQQATQGGPSLASLQQAIQEDVQSTGGKNINNLMQLGQLYGIVDSSGNPVSANTGAPNVGKVTAQQYGLATSGMQSLQALGSLLQGDPSLLNKSATPGQTLPVVGGFVKKAVGTNQYDATLGNVVDALLRLRTGAAATKDEINMYKNQFAPQAGDPPQAIQAKLQQLYQDFLPFLSSNQNSNDLLSQLNGAQ